MYSVVKSGEEPPKEPWEIKGAELFRKTTPEDYPQNIRIVTGVFKALKKHGGKVFYYVDEKPIGTPKQTGLDQKSRESEAMKEVLNRLCKFADSDKKNLLVLMTQFLQAIVQRRSANWLKARIAPSNTVL